METAVATVVANVIVGQLVSNLIDRLKVNFNLIKKVKKNVEKLSSMLSAINTVLEDAESTQFKDKLITDWLTKIKDAAYDAEDVFDDWFWEQEKVTNRKVSHFISTCFDFTPFGFRRKIAKRLKSVMARFDDIAKEKSNFHFKTSDVSSQMESEFTKNRESSSHLSEPKIYGREEDLKEVVDMLLQTDHSSQEDILIIPIVGFGGVGKTTLAQLVYKHERIVRCFDIRIWVCVSDPFDVKRVLKQILDSFGGCNPEGLDILQNKVLESLKHKKYLLVLDDVWSENEDAWNKLRSSLASGAKGSSIMVTTRLPRVASIASNGSPQYNLGVLPDGDCWSLLKSRAFGDKGEEHHPDLVPIGMEIAKKCKGIPLAAKSLGSLLKFKTKESYWTHVRDHPIWKLDNDEGNSILAALRLSYNHLPSRLMQCFSYVSIYPKDSYMHKNKLIYLWMANGFIQSQGSLDLEEVGDDMFHELLQRSFFQDTEEDEYGNVEFFKMHDLMHDLACSVAANECSITEVGGVKDVPKTIRHLSVIRDSKRSSTVIDPVIASKSSFRTLFFFEPIDFHSFKFSTNLRVLNLHDMRLATLPPSICKLKYLRYLDLNQNNLASLPESVCRLRNLQMLDLSGNEITTLPDSIGTLENLRYLSLSNCYRLTSIPESIGNVVSLRYLSLSGCDDLTSIPESIGNVVSLSYLSLSNCYRLTSIPESIGNVVSLRHLVLSECESITVLPESICNLRNLENLDLGGCVKLEMLVESMKGMNSLRHLDISSCYGLKKMPLGLGESVYLQRLGCFVVGGDSGCGGINELHGLNQLRGFLHIYGLENVRNAKEAKEANLIDKVFLESLTLRWGNMVMGEEIESKEVLEWLLHLPPNLQRLMIQGYPGAGVPCFPQGLNHSRLTELRILECPNLKYLPEGMMQYLTSLRKFKIYSCIRLKSLWEGLQCPTSLETLKIHYCWEMEFEANDFQHLISLRQLRLKSLPKLIALPVMGILGSNNTLLKLEISGCKSLKSVSDGLQYLTSLETLFIEDCGEVEFEANDFQHLISLRELKLYKLPKLIALPVMGSNSTLLEFRIWMCGSLKSVSEGLQYLTSLEALKIGNCGEVEFAANDFEHLISLHKLTLKRLPKLRALPEGTTTLQQLKIEDCENLTRLPQGIEHITTLRYLTIKDCHEELHTRCEREKGQDWNLIAHIPNIDN